jgi:hypothetical protein
MGDPDRNLNPGSHDMPGIPQRRRALNSLIALIVVAPSLALSAAEPTQPPAPRADLSLESIELTADCRIKVSLKNVGEAALPEASYDPEKGILIQGLVKHDGWGAHRLSSADPQRKLAQPGGSLSFIGFKRGLEPGETLSFLVAILDRHRTSGDRNPRNNSNVAILTCPDSAQKN